MGEVVLYIATSLDGYVADEDGDVEWLETFEDSYEDGEEGSSYETFFEDVDCLVMGSNTYEQILSFGEWPYEDRRTIVTTQRDLRRANDHVEFFSGEVGGLVRSVTDDYDRIWLVGGAALAQSFLAEGHIDEVRLSIVPVLLGGGIALFGPSSVPRRLHLTDETAFESGIVELHYEVRDE